MSNSELNQTSNRTDESGTSRARVIFNMKNKVMKHCISLQICKVDPVIFVKRGFLEQDSERCKVCLRGRDMQSSFTCVLRGDGRVRASDEEYFETFFIRLLA